MSLPLWHHQKPVCPVLRVPVGAPSSDSLTVSVTKSKMPRNGRRKRSLSSGEDSLVSYYSKHRCLEREYSPVSETRHLKRGSSPIRSRERRHNRQLTRNRSRSTRRSDRKTRRHKHRNDFPDSHAVRSHISVFVFCGIVNRRVKLYY